MWGYWGTLAGKADSEEQLCMWTGVEEGAREETVSLASAGWASVILGEGGAWLALEGRSRGCQAVSVRRGSVMRALHVGCQKWEGERVEGAEEEDVQWVGARGPGQQSWDRRTPLGWGPRAHSERLLRSSDLSWHFLPFVSLF